MGAENERLKILSLAEVAVLFQRGETALGVDQVHGSNSTSRAHLLIQAVTRAVQRRPIIQAQPTRR